MVHTFYRFSFSGSLFLINFSKSIKKSNFKGFENHKTYANKRIKYTYSALRFISTENTTYPNDKPQFEISYKEFVGEEDYWSYTSHGAGLNGSGQVNNYAGTLSVSENVLSYSGSRNPLSLANTYNNVNYNEHANGYIHTQTFAGGYSHSSSTGLGFRMSFNRLIYPIASTDLMYSDGWRYVYVDGDGTQHYFKVNGTVFTDEDGLGLTITNNSGDLIGVFSEITRGFIEWLQNTFLNPRLQDISVVFSQCFLNKRLLLILHKERY